MKKVICILFLLPIIFNANSQIDMNKGEIEQKHYLDTIPYRVRQDKIFIPVEINGITYNFLFDTGTTFAIYDNVYKELGIINSEEATLSDIHQKTAAKKIIMLPQMNIGKITFLNSLGMVFNKGDSKPLDCFDMDGVIGSNILRNSVVQIDSKNKYLIITDKTRNLSVKRKNSKKLKFNHQKTPILKIRLQNKPKVTDEIMFDTGDDSFYTMSNSSYELFKAKGVKVFNEIATAKGSTSFGFLGKSDEQNNILLKVLSYTDKSRILEPINKGYGDF